MSIGAAGSLLLTVAGKDLTDRARPPASLAAVITAHRVQLTLRDAPG